MNQLYLRKIRACKLGIGLLCVLLIGCSNNSSNGGTTPTGPLNPGFTVSLSSPIVTLAQGGAVQTVQVSVTAQNGFTGSVSASIDPLPNGITVSPASLTLSPNSPGIFSLSASSVAEIAQQTLNVSATSGTLTENTSLQLTVTGATVPDFFHLIGGSMTHGFYDESRQLLFTANLGLNELDVISGQDFSIKARVSVPQPLGIDQMADGKTLVIGTAAQEIVTVDEDTLTVTQHPYSAIGNQFYTLFFPNVVAMANGKVLIIGQEQGIESGDILDGGQYIYEWDSKTNTFTQLEPTGQAHLGGAEIDSLARSADHKWAVFAFDQFYLYSSDSDSLTSVSATAVNPPDDTYGIRGYAINSDGSKIAIASANQVTFLDRSFTVLGSTPIPYAFQLARTAIQFSPEDQKLFLQYSSPLAIEEIDANSYSALGYISGTLNPDDDTDRLLAVDTEGRAFIGTDGGLRLVNLMQSPVPNPSNDNLTGPYCPLLNAALPLNTTQQMPLSIPITGTSIYVGGQPAPLLDNGTTISIPASSTAGPVDVECIDTYGNTSVAPDGVSYGVEPLALSANLLPPTGNPVAYLAGFGFFANKETPSITIGGNSAFNVTNLAESGLGVFQSEKLQVPSGSPGEPAAITVSSSQGVGTLAAATTYYATPTILPASGLLQLTFDSHRNVLYALKANEVDVLDATTLQWQSPLTFPTAVTGIYNAMALTPDGSTLVVAGSAGTAPQLIAFDLDAASSPSVFTYTGTPAASLFGSVAVTKDNHVILAGSPVLEFDLSTSTFSFLPLQGGHLIRSSADGSHLYGVDLNDSGGKVYSIDSSTSLVQSEGFGQQFWTDLAISPDGSQFAAILAPPYGIGDFIGFFNSSLQYLNANVYPALSPPDDFGVLGATFSPEGKVLVVPLGDSIEFWDTAQGTLRARLMTPEELRIMVYPEEAVAPMIALDSIGKTIYAISASGLTVITLPEPLDQMTPMQWPLSRSSDVSPQLRGSLMQRMAAMHSNLKK